MISQTANIYADALMDLNIDKEVVRNDFKDIVDSLTPDFLDVFKNPCISTEKKLEILETAFKDKISNYMYDFLKILTEKNRFNIINEINEAFIQKYNIVNNLQSVVIISAIELDAKYKEKVISKLQDKLNKKIIPVWQISPDIIAGLVIKIGDNIIDTSLKNKINKLKKEMGNIWH